MLVLVLVLVPVPYIKYVTSAGTVNSSIKKSKVHVSKILVQIILYCIKYDCAIPVRICYPGDSQGIISYHSDQYINNWKQWRTDKSDHLYVSWRLVNSFTDCFDRNFDI